MSRHTSYGELLREARERKRMDAASVSRRLRIRPDILRAIEQADFSRLPAQGYTRNMITAYARLVGLDPMKISSMYLDEVHSFETGRPRASDAADQRRSSSRQRSASTRQTQGRQMPGRGEGRRASSQTGRDKQGRDHHRRVPLDASAGKSRRVPRTPEPQSGFVGGRSYPSLYSSNAQRSSSANRPIVFIGIAAVLLVLVIALVFSLTGKKQESDSLPAVPISGLTDTSSPEDEAKVKPAPTVPTSVKVEYKIASGQQVYAEITTDGQTEQVMLDGPKSEVVEVTGTWSFASWVIDAVKVTVDGKPIDYKQNDAGIPTWSVNFEDYLATWRAEHPEATADSSSSAASSASAASSSASSS